MNNHERMHPNGMKACNVQLLNLLKVYGQVYDVHIDWTLVPVEYMSDYEQSLE